MSNREMRAAGTLIAAAALAVGAAVTLSPGGSMPQAAAEPATPSTTSAKGSAYPTDEHGYVGSAARCDDGQTLMLYGRTSRSLVAVCVGPDGQLQYRGVRISDQAGLTMAATRSTNGTVIATNDEVSYSISPQAFLVSDGDTVVYRDAWDEFHEARFSSGATTTSATPTTTTPATTTTATSSTTAVPTVSTTTVTLTPTTGNGG